MVKDFLQYRWGMLYMEITIICLIILNICINIFLIRILANLTVNSFKKLNSELSDAITTVIEGAQSINMQQKMQTPIEETPIRDISGKFKGT